MLRTRRQRVGYDLDVLHGGGWVLWRLGPGERVVAEGRLRPVGWLVCWHRRLLRSRVAAPQPRPGLELVDQ